MFGEAGMMKFFKRRNAASSAGDTNIANDIAANDLPSDNNFVADFHNHSKSNYEALVTRLLTAHDEDEAMARAIGCPTVEAFVASGNGHVDVLKHHGLRDGMAVYDLGCGSGRTAAALVRSGWVGQYRGHDIVSRLVDYLRKTCPGYEATTHLKTEIPVSDDSIDIVFHWSVFTHLFLEECYNYMVDTFRALKPGGLLLFSFLELEDVRHFETVFRHRTAIFLNGTNIDHLDTFLHRGQIESMARQIGFIDIAFTDGNDSTHHADFWQSLVAMRKPR